MRTEEFAASMRREIIRMLAEAGSGHPGGSLSATDIMAVLFNEELRIDPEKPLERQYEMYGDPYGKSLCHAWAASPIYLLARYFVGLRPLSPGGGEYEVKPQTHFFKSLDCSFPMGGQSLHIRLKSGKFTIEETGYPATNI